MVSEQQIVIKTTPAVINLLSSLMPTLEGLYLVTVLDGREARASIRFHESQAHEVASFLQWLTRHHPVTVVERDQASAIRRQVRSRCLNSKGQAEP